MLLGAGKFILIALVTLPVAGVPFAIWCYLDYRRYTRAVAARLHLVASP